MMEENEIIDNLSPILLEYPFARKGMTVAEFKEEREYLGKHKVTDLKNGTYVPLWKQREMKNK